MTDNKGEVKWMVKGGQQERKDMQVVVDPKYSRVGERIRHIAPSALQCSMFCGGRQCKYDNPMKWKEDEMAIRGLYSSWITNNILAMARPSTYAIKEFDIISQFKQHAIAAVINLQHPGEHASCGFGLEDGGFSYVPQNFMDEDVFFYNYCWDDYGVRALQSILDMVKVMDFALMNGKVAIHCHAGLGRTGVLIACYFVYSQRMKADSAINAVRARRPRSIQTRGQIACVRDFEKYLQPMWIIYSNTVNEYKPFTLTYFLRRQAHILHGEEERDLRYVPKIVFVTCQRLLQLFGADYELRTIAILKRRGFTSLSLTDSSIDETSIGDQTTKLSADQKRRAGSDSLLHRPHENDDKDLLDASLDKNVFYDSFADETEGLSDMDEISPENVLHHSVSESVLFKDSKDYHVFNDASHSLHNVKHRTGQSVFVDEENNYTEMETARLSDADRGITIDGKRTGHKAYDFDRTTKLDQNRKKSDSERKVIGNSDKNPIKSQVSITITSSSSKQIIANEEREIKSKSFTPDDLEAFAKSIASSLSPKVNYTRISTALEKYKNGLNSSEATWEQISNENDINLLCCLLWNWLEHLEEPVITDEDIAVIFKEDDDPVKAFEKLDRGKRKTLQVVLFTILKITKMSDELKDKGLHKISMVFTKVVSLPQKTRSERTVLDQNVAKGKMQNYSSLSSFHDFIVKLSNSKLFEI